MTTRIYAVPDDKGVITVACGSTTLEIVVVPPGGGGGPGAGSDTDGSGGMFDKPRAMFNVGQKWRRERPSFDNPLTLHIRQQGPDTGFIDINSIVEHLETKIRMPGPNPLAVIVDAAKVIDLHEVEALSTRISDSDLDMGIAFDFGGDE